MEKTKYMLLFTFIYSFFNAEATAMQPVVDTGAINAIGLTTTAINKSSAQEAIDRAKEYIEMANQTTQLVKTVTTLESQLKAMEDQLKSLTENLNRANGFDTITKDLISQIAVEKPAFENLKDAKTGKELDPKKGEDLNVLIDQVIPPYGTGNIMNYGKVAESYRQRGRKAALQSADGYIYRYPKRMEQITDMVLKINETQSIKDSMDLNNRLLSEVLVEITNQNKMVARMLKVQASTGYDGEITKAKIEKVDQLKKRQDRFKPISTY